MMIEMIVRGWAGNNKMINFVLIIYLALVFISTVDSFVKANLYFQRKFPMSKANGDLEIMITDDKLSNEYRASLLQILLETKMATAETQISKMEAEMRTFLLERASKDIVQLKKENVELKNHFFSFQSEYAAVVATRPLIETWARLYLPLLSPTEAINNVTQSLLSKGKLTSQAKGWLRELEGSNKKGSDYFLVLFGLFPGSQKKRLFPGTVLLRMI